MLKRSLIGFSFCLALGLAACSQTYTAEDGTVKTADIPKTLLNVDETRAAFKEGISEIVPAKPGSKYHQAFYSVEASKFKNTLAPRPDVVIKNDGIQKVYTEALTENGFASSSGRYSLLVELDKISAGNSETPGTVLTIKYTIRDQAGNAVESFTETSNFNVSFKAVPFGQARGRLQFIGSLENNIAQLTTRLQ